MIAMSYRSSTVDLSSELLLMTDDIKTGRARPILQRFTQVIDALEKVKARYAVCGAIALGAHGARRFTEDIDVLVADEHLEQVAAALGPALRELGREPAKGPPKQIRLRAKRARSNRAVDVDLMAPVDAVEAWALTTAVRARAFERKVDVVSAEALVLMKLRAYLSDPGSDAGLKHLSDAMKVGRTIPLDANALRTFVRSHADLAAELERVLAAPEPRGRVR
jgi:hypothetical protein